MKVKMDDLDCTVLEEEMPEKCRKCGKDFREPNSLVELQYLASSQYCTLIDAGPKHEIPREELEPEPDAAPDEVAFMVGYDCGSCGAQVIPTNAAVECKEGWGPET